MRISYRLVPSLLAFLFLPLSGCSSSSSSGVPSPIPDLAQPPSPDLAAATDPVVSSFAVMGCNRLEFADWSPAANPSSANLAQLAQTFADVTKLSPRPSHFLFVGDLVINEAGDNGATLSAQLAGWAQVVKSDPSQITSKLALLPVVGNHELLKVVGGVQVPDLPTYGVWNSFLSTNGFTPPASNGPTMAAPNLDALTADQSKVSYSFDVGSSHLIVLNTDTPTSSNSAGQIPYNWLAADVAAAQASPSISNIFVFGHKPIADTLGGATSDRVIDPPLGSKFQTLIGNNKKVRAYLAAHDHTWDSRTLGTTGVTQIIAGNAGSKVTRCFRGLPRA
jgi:hypothetical protein